MSDELKYPCPNCGNNLTQTRGEDVTCNNCGRSYIAIPREDLANVLGDDFVTGMMNFLKSVEMASNAHNN